MRPVPKPDRLETVAEIHSAANCALEELAATMRRRLAAALAANGALTPQALFRAEVIPLIGAALDAYTETLTDGMGAPNLAEGFAQQVGAIAHEQATITLAFWDVLNGAPQP